MKRLRLRVPAALALSSAGAAVLLGGCSPAPSPDDGGKTDAGADAGKPDAGLDAGYDAGVDAGLDAGAADGGSDAGCAPQLPCTLRVNACGMNCGCIRNLGSDGGLVDVPYCDPDVGNPCPLGCFNPREADGGRQSTDAGPVCFC